MRGSVVIVGAGIVGASAAYFLREAGWEVTVVDRGRFGGGCSHANCGLICPSHILPLAEPGAVRRTLSAMLSKNSAFYIKPRFDLALWGFLWSFAKRCNAECMVESGKALQPLLESSMEIYERLKLDCEWEKRGLLFVYGDREKLDSYAGSDRILAESFGHPARKLDGAELAAMEPALKEGLAGAWFYEGDAHLRPDRFMSAMRGKLEEMGVVIREDCQVRGIVRAEGTAKAVVTSKGEITADAFVMASGAMTPLLNLELGCRVPIQPGKGYSMTMRRPGICPKIPLIFPETRVAVTPMQSGYRLGSMMEFAGYDESLRRERLDLLKRGAEPFLKEPYTEEVEEEWFGWRPMTSDGVPIVDFAPGMKNVMIAAGHNMIGMSAGPGTGRLVAEMMSGVETHIEARPYSLKRFL
jgi:D-amino-acid dehydrogenase